MGAVQKLYKSLPADKQQKFRRIVQDEREKLGWERNEATLYNWIAEKHELDETKRRIIATAFRRVGKANPFLKKSPRKSPKR